MNSQEVALYLNVSIYAGILIFSFFKLGKSLNVYVVILSIYLLSSIMGIVHFYSPLSDYRNIAVFPFVFFAGTLLMVIYPIYIFTKFTRTQSFATIKIGGIPDNLLFLITIFSLILCILPFIENINALIFGVNGNEDLASYLAEAHDDRQESYAKNTFQYSQIGKISYKLLEIIYEASFALLFYCILTKKRIWYLLTYTFVIVTVNFYQFLISVRSALLYTVLLLIIYFITFNQRISPYVQKTIKKFAIIIIAASISAFAYITFGRSEGNKQDNFALYFVAWYAGEPTLNFNEYIFDRKCIERGDYNFPRFKKILGLKTFDKNEKRRNYYSTRSGVPEQVFYTFLGNFIADFGWAIALLIMFLLSEYFIHLVSRIKKKNRLSATQLLLLLFLLKFVTCGVFFNPYSGYGNNLMLLYFILWLTFLGLIQINYRNVRYS